MVAVPSSETPQSDLSVSIATANLGALLLVGPAVAVLLGAFVLGYGWTPLYRAVVDGSLVGILLLIGAGVVAHEVLHVVGWRLAAELPAGAVRLGFQWRTLTPYAHCEEPMTARAYRIGAATPGIVLGIVPATVGLATGLGGWMGFGLMFTLAAGGDALVVWLLRGVPPGALVVDHPSRAGCLLITGQNPSALDQEAS